MLTGTGTGTGTGGVGGTAGAAAATVTAPSVGESGVRAALAVCGCSATLIDSIVDDDVDTMDSLRRLTNEDIVSLARSITSATVARGGTKFGITRVKKVQALCSWSRMRHACNLPIDANLFTEGELEKELDLCEIGENRKGKDESNIIKPKKFEPIEWVSWERSFDNYLRQMRGANEQVPLTYVIRKLQPPTYVARDEDERKLR